MPKITRAPAAPRGRLVMRGPWKARPLHVSDTAGALPPSQPPKVHCRPFSTPSSLAQQHTRASPRPSPTQPTDPPEIAGSRQARYSASNLCYSRTPQLIRYGARQPAGQGAREEPQGPGRSGKLFCKDHVDIAQHGTPDTPDDDLSIRPAYEMMVQTSPKLRGRPDVWSRAKHEFRPVQKKPSLVNLRPPTWYPSTRAVLKAYV